MFSNVANLKPIALRLGSRLALSRALGHDPQSALTTLLYHHFFAPGEGREAGRERLRRQLEWLRSRYTPLALADAVERLAEGTLPEFAVVVTVDDAKIELLDVYEEFKAFDVPITVGVVTGWTENEEPADAPASISRVVDFLEWYRGEPRKVELDGGESLWIGTDDRAGAIDAAIERAHGDDRFVARAWDALSGIEGREPGRLTCTWSELEDLQRRGVVMASHSVSHCRMALQSDVRQRFEAGESKAFIAQRLGSVDDFLYPYGVAQVVDTRTTDVLKQSGYRSAFLTHAGFATAGDSVFHLPRIVIPDHQVGIDEFRAHVSGARIPIEAVRRRLTDLRAGARGRTRETSAEILREPSQLVSVAHAWQKLRESSSPQSVSHQEYERTVADPLFDGQMLVVVLREGPRIVTLAPFVVRAGRKKYTLGERKLGSLPVRWLELVGDSFLGDVNAATVRRVFDELAKCRGFDLVSLGEIAMQGALYQSVKSGLSGSGWQNSSPNRRPAEHWVIDLPESFDAYLAQLSGKTRQTAKRKVRQFAENYKGRVEAIKTPDQIDRFLKVGEQISRLTYQWNVGQRLIDDEQTRQQYKRKAEAGVLRCYLAFAGDEPCAFLRGTIRDQVFDYETPGFDPRFSKASPGIVLLLKAIEDVIASSDCKIFDFGTGGDAVGYKSIYGTRSYKADVVELGRRFKPYPALLFGAQSGLLMARRAGHAVLGQSEFAQEIRRRLRKYGES